MSILPDPIFLCNLAKYNLGVNRPWKLSYEEMDVYRSKSLKKMIRYASEVPLYKDKFENANLNPSEIKDINDVKKLPIVTKQDLRNYKVPGTLHPNFNKDKAYKVDTSGSTGEPVSIYKDMSMIAAELTTMLRMFKSYNLDVRNSKTSNIGDFSLPDSYDEECLQKGAYEKLGFLSPVRKGSMQSLFAGEDVSKIMKKLEAYEPDLIVGYPGTLIGLMVLKAEGKGENLNPKYVVSSGGVLDKYTKKRIEDLFDTRVLDLYAATESGTVGFECLNGNYHIQSDYVNIEAIDEKENRVPAGEHGHIVITRLYGKGTPILRYTGMNDYVTLLDEKCDCGMHTPLIKKVEGRSADSIVLPNGRIFPAATFTLIPGEVAQDFGVDIIQRFQIIQHKKEELKILIVINEKERDKVKSVDKVLEEIKNRYQKIVGKEVNINIIEVDKVEKDKRSEDSKSSIVLSYVEHKQWL